jgi:hypothetical protein
LGRHPGFRRGDVKAWALTFYEFINIGMLAKNYP